YSCIAPCSVWFTKQVPAAQWLQLIQNILTDRPDEVIYLLGGPDDRTACESILSAGKNDRVVSLAGTLNFLQTASLMQDARMNYVNDSAPLHIASAMNAPVTAFFCSTVPEFGFGPLSEHAFIREVKELPCKPCGLHGHRICPKSHFRCAHELDMNA
ncbi:MAG: glycosyltransferase family 9 protein, partial [Bacteroidota bacterium]